MISPMAGEFRHAEQFNNKGQMKNLPNMAVGDIQVFVTEDKKIPGQVLIVRYNGADGKLAGSTGYECAVPLDQIGTLEFLVGEVRTVCKMPDFNEIQEKDALNQQKSDAEAELERQAANAHLLIVERKSKKFIRPNLLNYLVRIDEQTADGQKTLDKLDIEPLQQLCNLPVKLVDGKGKTIEPLFHAALIWPVDRIVQNPGQAVQFEEILHFPDDPQDWTLTEFGIRVANIIRKLKELGDAAK